MLFGVLSDVSGLTHASGRIYGTLRACGKLAIPHIKAGPARDERRKHTRGPGLHVGVSSHAARRANGWYETGAAAHPGTVCSSADGPVRAVSRLKWCRTAGLALYSFHAVALRVFGSKIISIGQARSHPHKLPQKEPPAPQSDAVSGAPPTTVKYWCVAHFFQHQEFLLRTEYARPANFIKFTT